MVNRYVIHSDGYTSFERRWGRNYERAICEFGEALLYLPPQHKKLPQARPTDAEMRLARKSFRNWRKLCRRGNRRTKSTNSTKTTTRLQIRSRTTKQKFPARLGRHDGTLTTRHLQRFWRRNYNRQRGDDLRKTSDNRRT